jgi:hypothetical protein
VLQRVEGGRKHLERITGRGQLKASRAAGFKPSEPT